MFFFINPKEGKLLTESFSVNQCFSVINWMLIQFISTKGPLINFTHTTIMTCRLLFQIKEMKFNYLCVSKYKKHKKISVSKYK